MSLVRPTSLSASARALLTGLQGKSLLRIDNYSPAEFKAVLEFSHVIKGKVKAKQLNRVLQGESLSMIFQKRSTRTRVSTETGCGLLGAQALFLSTEDVQLGVNESLKDSSVVLSRYNSMLLARVFGHDTVQQMAEFATVPVINALSASHHPLQSLADYMTLQEHFGNDLSKLELSWVGDGNNVCADLMLGGTMLGLNVRVATPPGEHQPEIQIVDAARSLAAITGGRLNLFHDPVEAVYNANVVVTDTWVSMGQEAQKAARLSTFRNYKVTRQLCASAHKDWVFLHCLPRHPEEVEDEVFYSNRSLVFDEAENRMYTVMAVMCAMLGKLDV